METQTEQEIKSVAKALSVLRCRGFNIMKIIHYYRMEKRETGEVVRGFSYSQILNLANNKIKFEDFIDKNGYR